MDITSIQNPTVKSTVRLRKRSERDARGVFPIEGYREVKRALENDWPLHDLFYCRDLWLGENEMDLLTLAKDREVRLIETSDAVFSKLSYRDRPDGLLAIGQQRHQSLDALSLGEAPLILLAESIEKPGNLGTMLRAADAAGVSAMLVCDPQTDLYNPNVVRASVGTLFSVPCVVCSSRDALDWCKAQKLQTVAATPDGHSAYYDCDLSEGTVIAIGSEQYGLSELFMEEANQKVLIPMYGQVDSLNAATSSALFLFEALRQRNQHS